MPTDDRDAAIAVLKRRIRCVDSPEFHRGDPEYRLFVEAPDPEDVSDIRWMTRVDERVLFLRMNWLAYLLCGMRTALSMLGDVSDPEDVVETWRRYESIRRRIWGISFLAIRRRVELMAGRSRMLLSARDDMVSAACEHALKAIVTYDAGKGFRFTTYLKRYVASAAIAALSLHRGVHFDKRRRGKRFMVKARPLRDTDHARPLWRWDPALVCEHMEAWRSLEVLVETGAVLPEEADAVWCSVLEARRGSTTVGERMGVSRAMASSLVRGGYGKWREWMWKEYMEPAICP